MELLGLVFYVGYNALILFFFILVECLRIFNVFFLLSFVVGDLIFDVEFD